MDVQERVLDGGKINRSQSHGTQVYERRDQGLLLLPLLPLINLPPSKEKNHQFNSSPCLFLVLPKKTKIIVKSLELCVCVAFGMLVFTIVFKSLLLVE